MKRVPTALARKSNGKASLAFRPSDPENPPSGLLGRAVLRLMWPLNATSGSGSIRSLALTPDAITAIVKTRAAQAGYDPELFGAPSGLALQARAIDSVFRITGLEALRTDVGKWKIPEALIEPAVTAFVGKLMQRIDALEDNLDPGKGEVLTIACLRDRVVILEYRREGYEKTLKTNIDRIERTVEAQVADIRGGIRVTNSALIGGFLAVFTAIAANFYSDSKRTRVVSPKRK